jgi:hypothetical protein
VNIAQRVSAGDEQSVYVKLYLAGHSDLALGASAVVVNGVAALRACAALCISSALFERLAAHCLATTGNLAGCAAAAATATAATCGSSHAWSSSAGLLGSTNLTLAARRGAASEAPVTVRAATDAVAPAQVQRIERTCKRRCAESEHAANSVLNSKDRKARARDPRSVLDFSSIVLTWMSSTHLQCC